MSLSPFHLALPIDDIASAKAFYIDLLGCEKAREAERWVDINFYGHQVSLHLKPEAIDQTLTNPVDGEKVPVRHFGIVLDWDVWHEFVERLTALNVDYVIEPTIRFKGNVGEQATFFIKDPCGNCLEFKSFKEPSQLFAT